MNLDGSGSNVTYTVSALDNLELKIGEMKKLYRALCMKCSSDEVNEDRSDMCLRNLNAFAVKVNEIKIARNNAPRPNSNSNSNSSSSVDNADTWSDSESWMDWRKPTVSWLVSAKWHQINELKGVYKDLDEYTETMCGMWTMLTFYWGTGALWPRCHHSQAGGDSTCNQPMITLDGVSGVCRTRNCNNNVQYRCYRHGHDGVCRSCLHRGQEQLMGNPSPQVLIYMTVWYLTRP